MSNVRKNSVLSPLLNIILLVAVSAVCLYPLLPLQEGSFLFAILSPLHNLFQGYINVFASDALRPYGLYPVIAICALNTILALCGSGIFATIFRLTFFYGAYLVGIYVQGDGSKFEILKSLPEFYHFIGLALILVSIIFLAIVGKAKPKKQSKTEQPKEEPKEEETTPIFGANLDFIVPENSVEEEPKDEEPEVKNNFIYDPELSKQALKSFEEVNTPEFESFPNYTSSSTVSSVNKSIYGVAEREAQILKEEKEKREALERERQRQKEMEEERLRQEAEENRKRLENMFKPRTLLKRLNEEAQAEKEFPTYNTSPVSNGIPQTQIQKPKAQFHVPEPEPEKPKVQFKSTAPAEYEPVKFGTGPVSQQAPISQQTQPEVEDYVFKPSTQKVFKEASEQADIEEQLIARRRQAELEKKHLEEIEALEKSRREAEAAAAKAEAELEEARAELQRQLEARSKASAPVKEIEPEEDDDIANADVEETSSTTATEDIDYVSGVAGTKSANSGNSYLLDKQKFVYKFPPEDMLKHYPVSSSVVEDIENDANGQIIINTLRDFRIESTLVDIQHGPAFTLYEISLQKGIKVTSVSGCAENLAMELSVDAVRILAPIPGKPLVGIEVPNKKREIIGFDVMMPALKEKSYKIPMVLGKTITGESIVIDVAKTPHLLVAGTTGSGKSVCVNGLICSVLFTKTPKDVRMILVDPKEVEFSVYNGIPHLLTPVITDPKKAIKAMNYVVEEMNRRKMLLRSIGAKNIEDYNQKIVDKKLARVKLPYIMVIVDEFADIMLSVGKELETSIKKITAVARFSGIHLILATQRPSADVITGIIKSNIPTQIAFAVSNSTNSRIILDANGAENLLGRGDMLYKDQSLRNPKRIQGAYLDSEIEEIVEFVKTQGEPDYIDESYFEDDDDDEEDGDEESVSSGEEDMFNRAWKIVSDKGEASASYIQRKLSIGYNRAANLMEQLEEAGYVGPQRGSKAREILKFYGSE